MSVNTQAAQALVGREIWRTFRQPTRFAFTLGVPVMLWVLAGAGLAESFSMPTSGADAGISYARFILPGMMLAVIVFGAVYYSMSLIQDRRAGFLQSVLVSPTPRAHIVASKVISGALITGFQALILMGGALWIGLDPGPMGFVFAILAMVLTAVGVVSMGMTLAWWINSTKRCAAVLCMTFVPLWLLSGALFPVEGAEAWLRMVVRVNPLHWGQACIRSSMDMGGGGWIYWVGLAAFAGGMYVAALRTMSSNTPGSVASRGE